MTVIDATLLSCRIRDFQWQATEVEGVYALFFAHDDDAARASDVLAALWREERERHIAPIPSVQLPMWQQPAFAWGVSVAALLLTFFWVSGPANSGSVWHARGAFIHDDTQALTLHRMVTAATLHADVQHATANAGFALIMFWAAAERLGAGVATAIWLLTAVGGFAASAVWGAHPSVVVGASGGLFGLWGAICGHAWRYPTPEAYKPRARTLGVVVMLMGMMAFSRQADIASHLGGCAVGILTGLLSRQRPWGPLMQGLCALATAAMLARAWSEALR